MSKSRQALQQQAKLLIRWSRSDMGLGAVERQSVAAGARALAVRAGDRILEAEALLQVGRTLAPPADPAAALEALGHARGIYVANDLPQFAGACRLGEAQVLADLGEERRAIALARQALDEGTLRTEDQVFCLILIGLCHSHLGELDLALRYLADEALPLAERCAGTALPAQVCWAQGLTLIRLLIWHRHRALWRGWPGMPPITTAAPEVDTVAAMFERARALLPPGQRWPYIEMGLHFALGLGDSPAMPLLQLAQLTASHRVADPPFAARALYCQGMIMRRHGQTRAALAVFEEGLALAESVQSLSIVGDALLQVSRLHEDMGDAARALAAYKRFSELRLKSLLPPDGKAVEAAVMFGFPAPVALPQPLRSLEPAYLRRALRFIEAGGGGAMAVEDVARHCGVSRRTLELAFREYRSDSVMACIKRRQMEVAAERLHRTALSVQAVAELAGYRSQAAFAREFRKHLGLPPSRWRSKRPEPDAD